jgi:DNA polymerase elongation subunit (family B)|tara:strand:- start:660 stop:3182 length:2523 start_codon:yes stop_codon:yes gene_type:complete
MKKNTKTFYTNAFRFGKTIKYTGYENGRKVSFSVPFKPVLHVTAPKTAVAKWHALDGSAVEPIIFPDMSEATNFIKSYKDIPAYKIYGNTNYVAQYLNEEYPGEIAWDRNIINVTSLDIECKFGDGFPEPELADQEITAITTKNNIDDTYHTFGCKPYDVSKALMKDRPVRYTQCHNEKDLLYKYISHMESTAPDVITGWNVEFFDIPYLVNRIAKINGEAAMKRLSPWGLVDMRETKTGFGQSTIKYELKGIAILDYMAIFKKFGYTYGPQESYKLDHIANVVLGEKKLDYGEASDLNELYEKDYQKFIDYNIKDVELIDRMEDKLGLITLCLTMAYKGGVNYDQVLGTVAIWDSIIYRDLSSKNVAVPMNSESFKGDYPGGYVKEPQVGMHDWVCSFDLNSLYPSIIMQYNMSPETILLDDELGVNVEAVLAGEVQNTVQDTALAVNGTRFCTKKLGVLPSIIQEIYTERVGHKQLQLKAQQELELCTNKTEVYALEKRIAIAKNQQMALKILLNSLYGAMGNKWFRYFDMRIAEGITLTGQATIRWAEQNLNNYLNAVLKTDKDYIVAIDTDSVYVTLDALVKQFNPKNPVDFLDKICSTALEDTLTKCYAELYDSLGGIQNHMVMGREVIADRGIWTAKKRYILNVHDNEGVRYAQPKLKIMGIEAIKSSTPAICRQALKDIFKRIIETDEETVQEDIANFKIAFSQASPEEVSFPRGVNNIAKWTDRDTIYKKGTPIHIRGAILHNNIVTAKKLGRSIQKITSGDKVKFTYLIKPNPIKENVIAFVDYMPKQFKLDKYVDYNLQFEKTFLGAIEPVLEAVGWKSERHMTLESFFC